MPKENEGRAEGSQQYPHLPEDFDPSSLDFPVYQNAILTDVEDFPVLIQGVAGGKDPWEVRFLTGPFEGRKVILAHNYIIGRRPYEIALMARRRLIQRN